jgi:hypothetical protein
VRIPVVKLGHLNTVHLLPSKLGTKPFDQHEVFCAIVATRGLEPDSSS